MTRLAIVVGCSIYSGQAGDLPAAGNDARALSRLLGEVGSYDEVLTLVDLESASAVKEALSVFVKKHQKSAVDEVLFYFSGHGLYRDNEFFYILKNYDELRPRETGLENTELDDLLRALRPGLTIKIVDACNSGVPYIKGPLDPSQLQKHIDETQERFSKCYFLFSSYRDQSSYADDQLSWFTRALLGALAERPIGTIRFKDLVSAVADVFDGDPRQRPFFVIQADQTEVFCSLTDELKGLLKQLLEPNGVSDNAPPELVSLVVGAVERDAARFVTEGQAMTRLSDLLQVLTTALVPIPLRDLYAVACLQGTTAHPGAAEIGEWLKDYGTDVLAKPTFKLVSEIETMMGKLQGVIPRKYESSDVAGYAHTVSAPYSSLELKARPVHMNLHPFKLIIVPLLTRADVHLFSGVCEYHHKTWTEIRLVRDPTWKNDKVSLLGNGLEEAAAACARRLWEAVAKHVTTAANMKKEEAEGFLRLVRAAT